MKVMCKVGIIDYSVYGDCGEGRGSGGREEGGKEKRGEKK
jgi:hypothetical protein